MRAALVIVAGLAGTARAECPDNTPKAACVLHEEAVELLTAGKFEDAATKFRAAIGASPSARSYLGYSQAVEGQGKIALAYETMLVAQRLSNEEMAASGGKDAQIVGRAERIKYKLSELGGRVGFVWLRVPEGVPPQRLVSVHREREGDLPSPLGRWVTVAPNRQVLIAALDDGSQLEVIAAVAPGAQSSLVIPIGVARPGTVQQPPGPPPPGPTPGLGRPLAQLYQQPPPAPPPPMPSAMFAVGVTVLAPGVDPLTSGTGVTALFENRLSTTPLGIAARLDYVFHPSDFDFVTDETTSGSELLLMAGLRTMSRTIHARTELGFDVLTINRDSVGISSSDSAAHPCFALGGGLAFGRFRLHTSALWTFGDGDVRVRFMGTLGIDLWRKQ